MLRLQVHEGPRWIALAGGAVELQVRPLSAVIFAAALSEVADLDSGDAEVRYVALTSAIARLAVLDWRGVGDGDDQPLPVTPEAVTALMDLYRINCDFAAVYVTPYLSVVQEKKGSAPLSNGISAGAPNIATPAPDPVPAAQPN